jgi:ribosomal-protein-alanine N-acetyltransferase
MSLYFAPMDEVTARAIHGWRYEAPYDLYDLADEPLLGLVRAFLDPQNAYYAIFDQEGVLVAYCCYGPDAQVPGGDYGLPAVDVGLGLRPDLTGQGQGLSYVQAVLDFAQQASDAGSVVGALRTALPAGVADPPPFRVTVAAFNLRARRVWEKAGFRIVQRFERAGDALPFVVMIKP